ncbi:MAG: hypothetical protein ACRDQA_13005 [Nocardioidaceae bacterium]
MASTRRTPAYTPIPARPSTPHPPTLGACGIKWLARYAKNPVRTGLPAWAGVYVLNDPDTGHPRAIMEASWITDIRTAVVTALTLHVLRPAGTERLAFLGFGAQGRSHVGALPQLCPTLRTIRVYSRRPAVARQQVAAMSPDCDVRVCLSVEEALAESDAVVSATPISQPPRHDVTATALPDGSAVVALDFDTTWHPSIFDRVAAFAVDDLAQYRLFQRERGFFAGYPTDAVELPELLSAGTRLPSDGLLYANTLGMGLEDLVVAQLAYRAAVELGIGTPLQLY